MATNDWSTKPHLVASLHLDAKNPRLGRQTMARAPREIIQYLFEHDKAMDVAQSIATRGYFPNEPLLAIKVNGQFVIVEGNRRLAALKALREPGLLEGRMSRKIERLSRQIEDPNDIARVPVTLAPSRKATDRLLAGRHIGTPVMAWQAENRASFILDKLAEGYTNEQLRDQLGFDLGDVQAARQTRAIADMARSLDLPEEVKAKLENPRAKTFTTLERVFDSSVGREYLKVKPDPEHGLRGATTKAQFLRGFKKLVSDIALGHESSRSLNSNDDIKAYFKKWDPKDLPAKRQGSFVPADIIEGKSVASSDVKSKDRPISSKSPKINDKVLPRDFKVRYGNDRLRDIRDELVKLKRSDFPNAGAVLLRVFFELAVRDYFERTGRLQQIITEIESERGGKVPLGSLKLSQLLPEIRRLVDKKLSNSDANKIKKAIKYDRSAPFTISDLHGFVHQADFPGERDILQFWKRTEPLFRLMLEEEQEGAEE